MEAEAGGPYLTMAVLCERVLEEKDGVLSAIRIVDRISHAAVGLSVPQTMPAVPVNLVALLNFKSGSARGRGTVKLTLQLPSGLMAPLEVAYPVLFEGDDRGVNIILNLAMQLEQEGLHWFNVFLDDRLVTKMPLRLIWQPMGGTAPRASG